MVVIDDDAEAFAMMTAMPKRVLYVVSLFPCWSETFIVREITTLIALGVDVRIISLKHPSEAMVQPDAAQLLDRVWHPQSAASAGWHVGVVKLHHPLIMLRLFGLLLRGLWKQPLVLLKSMFALLRGIEHLDAIRRFNPDFIHSHWATYPSTVALALAKLTGKPWGFTCHAHDIFVDNQLLETKLTNATLPVTISRYNVDYLSETITLLARQRLHVVHCGVDLSAFAFRHDGREPSLLLAVGRLDPIKGFDVLLLALAKLATAGVVFRCVIIGEGQQRAELEQSIAMLDLRDRVQLLGARPQVEVRALLHRATAFVLPSTIAADGNRDGIPVALMEAMAVGAPVISTRVSGIPELIGDDVSGLLVDGGDADTLAGAIRRLLGDVALRERLARSAREVVEHDFDAAHEASKLLAAMAESIAAGASR